ncbi:MAG: fibronectin type III domain-containing protein, partial [Thermoplasmata archaeon]
KVTNTIGLRFRPVIKAESTTSPDVDLWDGAEWDARSTRYLQELIHRSGEIHDPWDWMNVSTAYDDERYYLHVSHHDPNGSEAYELDLAWLEPGMVSVEETFNLLDWSDILGHMAVEEGVADVWNFQWNSTSQPEGVATDWGILDGAASIDGTGPDDLDGWTWREGEYRHFVLSRAFDTGNDDGDVAFLDRARTYVMRMALWTSDRDEVFITFPMSIGFEPDPEDETPPTPLTGVVAEDGGDSDITFDWDASADEDFGQYRVYIQDQEFTTLEGMVPEARISDPSVEHLHMRGIRPGEYHVAVVAVDDNKNVPASISPIRITVTDDTPPPALGVVKAFDNLDSDILVSWEVADCPDVDRYEVFMETSAFDDTTALEPHTVVRGLRSNSLRIGGLEAGETYHVAVVPVDWKDNADRQVTSVSATPTDVMPPPEVRGLDASTPQDPESDGEVLLKWRATGAEDVAGYNVYLSLTPITTLQNFAPWGFVDTPDTSLVVDGLNAGATYHFAVTALDTSGHEGPSKYTVSAIASTAEPPEPVRGLVAVQAGEDSVRLSWPAVNRTGAPVVNYQVYVSTEPIVDLEADGVLMAGNVTPTTEPTHLVTDLEVGTTYYFCVVTEDGSGRTSDGPPQMASVSLPVPKEEGPSTWEVIGPPLTIILILLLCVLTVYVVVTRHRRYGRLMSRRPRWERNGNGGKE